MNNEFMHECYTRHVANPLKTDWSAEGFFTTGFSYGFEAGLEESEKNCDALQAQIDRLMLEFCPEDMTEEQIRVWGEHQKPSKIIADISPPNSLNISV